MQDVIEAAKERSVKHGSIVSRRDYYTFGNIALDELQKGIEDSPHLPHLIVARAIGTYCIEFVE